MQAVWRCRDCGSSYRNQRANRKKLLLLVSRKRQKAHVIAAPTGMLERRALIPHEVQRARCLSRSLDAVAPQRMTATAQASGA